MYKQRTFSLKEGEATSKWYLVDAEGAIVGRLASKIADVLSGKNNPQYTPHTDSGDFVVVINAGAVRFTGNKWGSKKYHRHSGYVGGLKSCSADEQREKHPELLLYNAVKGMLPKTSLGRRQLKKLKIFPSGEHVHLAQNPQPLKI